MDDWLIMKYKKTKTYFSLFNSPFSFCLFRYVILICHYLYLYRSLLSNEKGPLSFLFSPFLPHSPLFRLLAINFSSKTNNNNVNLSLSSLSRPRPRATQASKPNPGATQSYLGLAMAGQGHRGNFTAAS